MDPHLLKKAAHLYRAVNHHLRQQLLHLLHQNGQMTVSAIYQTLQIEQSLASLHLGILRRAGMVSTVRQGRELYYRVEYRKLQVLHTAATKLLGEKQH